VGWLILTVIIIGILVISSVASAARGIREELRVLKSELYGGGIREELYYLRMEILAIRVNSEAQTGIRTAIESKFKSNDSEDGKLHVEFHTDLKTTRLPLSMPTDGSSSENAEPMPENRERVIPL
jgi:hypothetical protein